MMGRQGDALLFSYQYDGHGAVAIALEAARIAGVVVGNLGSIWVIEVSCCAWFNNPMSIRRRANGLICITTSDL